MQAIERGGLLLIPRVTDMRNGMFRPEVVYRKGRASDIIFGEVCSNLHRAKLQAVLAVEAGAVNTQTAIEQLWAEAERSIFNTRLLAERLVSTL